MVKKTVFLLFLCIGLNQAYAQRFLTKVFDSVFVTADIPYGFNYNYKGDSTTLLMDIYAPVGDTMQARPVVVLAHGGSFVQGSRKSADISTVCRKLGEMGYVTISIDYRLGINITSGKTLEQEFAQAVFRATQDGRAAVRFIYKSIANGNTQKLDINQIYTGGISAGGVLGLHLAFLDAPAELATLPINTDSLGGLEGNSGNPGYSWKVKGVVSLCGALSNVAFINNNKDISICNMHGTADATVPYKTDYFKFFGNNVALLQGSYSVDSAAQKQGIDTRLYTFNGADHVPFSGTSATQQKYMDTTLTYVAKYLYKHVTGITPTSILEPKNNSLLFDCYPNPSTDIIELTFTSTERKQIKLIDMQGSEVKAIETNGLEAQLLVSDLAKGMYLIEVKSTSSVLRKHILVQ